MVVHFLFTFMHIQTFLSFFILIFSHTHSTFQKNHSKITKSGQQSKTCNTWYYWFTEVTTQQNGIFLPNKISLVGCKVGQQAQLFMYTYNIWIKKGWFFSTLRVIYNPLKSLKISQSGAGNHCPSLCISNYRTLCCPIRCPIKIIIKNFK